MESLWMFSVLNTIRKVRLLENLYETLFITNYYNEDIEEDEESNGEEELGSALDQLGEILFSSVGHETRSRSTRPPQRYADM